MKYEIVEHSPKVNGAKVAKFELDLQTIPVGKSAVVPLTDIGEGALRTAVSRRARKLGISCQVVKHETCYEVARIK